MKNRESKQWNVDLALIFHLIALNVNGLNMPVHGQKFEGWIEHNLAICGLWEIHF
jgi:hypothetical protein